MEITVEELSQLQELARDEDGFSEVAAVRPSSRNSKYAIAHSGSQPARAVAGASQRS